MVEPYRHYSRLTSDDRPDLPRSPVVWMENPAHPPGGVFFAPYRDRQLLRPRSHRPCRGAADQPDECAPPHSITSSARARSIGGTSRPRSLAVLRLMTRCSAVG